MEAAKIDIAIQGAKTESTRVQLENNLEKLSQQRQQRNQRQDDRSQQAVVDAVGDGVD